MPLWDTILMLAHTRARAAQYRLWPVPYWALRCHLGFWGEDWWLMEHWLCKHWLISTCTAVVSLFVAWACSLRSMEGIACVNKMVKANQRASWTQLWNCYIHQEVHTHSNTPSGAGRMGGAQQQKEEMGEHRRSEKNWTLWKSWDCWDRSGRMLGR